jgi:predicted dehydrogenase
MTQHHLPEGRRGPAGAATERGEAAGPLGLTRREFLRRTALTGGAIAIPYFVPAAAMGRDDAVAPSERIVLGGLGLGGRGTGVLSWMLHEPDVQFVAICDVKKERREAIKNMVDDRYGNKDCATYRDLREFLAERTDLDAVLTATGDRWHALASVLAMKAGKDVYSEKPGTLTIAEGQALVEAERRYGRVYQGGMQRLSEANFTFAVQLARTGRLGQVHTLRAHIAGGAARTSHDWLPAEPEPPKEEMDWDLWLGPVPWRPYNRAYVGGAWRGYYDFHTGSIGEWGSHTIAQCQAAIDAGDTSPVAYEYPHNDTGDGLVARYANGVQLVLQQGGWHGSCGVRFEGSEGWVAVADGYSVPEVSAPSLLSDFKKLVQDYMDQHQRPMNHVRDFFDCIRTRRRTVANAEVTHRSMTTCHCANICEWLERDLKWDPVKEEFVGDAEANRLRSRAVREPWWL